MMFKMTPLTHGVLISEIPTDAMMASTNVMAVLQNVRRAAKNTFLIPKQNVFPTGFIKSIFEAFAGRAVFGHLDLSGSKINIATQRPVPLPGSLSSVAHHLTSFKFCISAPASIIMCTHLSIG
jgi:hypothetical protein